MSPHLRAYILRHRGAFVTTFVMVVVAVGLAMIPPIVIRYAIDDLSRAAGGGRLPLYAATIVAAALLEGLARFVMRLRGLSAARRIEYEIRRDYYAHLLRMPMSFYHQSRIGDLMARAVNDINAVQRFVGVGSTHGVNTIVMFVVTVGFMLGISPRLTLYVLPVLPLVTVVFVLLGRQVGRRFERVQAEFATVSVKAQENFSGIRVIKAFAQEPFELAEFADKNRVYMETTMAWARVSAAIWPATMALLGLTSVILLWQGGREAIVGRITLGQFVQFSAYLMRLSWPMVALGWVFNLLQQGLASWRRLEEIFSTRPAIADPRAPARVERIGGEVEFRDVTVRFDGTTALDHLSLRIPKGATVALVGPLGSGKSTLVHLIPRLLDPTEGQVLIDGVDVRRIPLETLRRTIGFVPQETFLFSETLAENIAYGVPAVEPDRVRWAADVSRLARDVGDFVYGYDTVLGERGVTLSGGQKQRTAISRAVVRDPAILVLDDALSSVDTSTEDEILRGLRGVMADRTSIIISHRISTVKDADLIVVLDEGRIVEQGTHDELLARDGLYADLYRKQLLQEELEREDDAEPAPRDDGAVAAGADGAGGASDG